jgi:ERCC4-related helicase
MKTWGVNPELVLNYEKLVRGNTKWLTYDAPPKFPNGQVNKDYPRWALTRLHCPDNALIILDEAHRCKAFNSLSAGLMIACKKQGYKLLNLTATLACDPREMRASGYANNLMRSFDSKSYKAFCIEHGAEWLGRWGALVFNPEDERAQAKMKAIHHSLFDIQKCASRLTRSMMAEYFPENQVDATAYTMDDINTKKIQAVYDWLDRELERLYEHCENYGECILTLILEARQQIELLKVPLFVELIEDAYDEGNSVVCFVNFTRTLEAISTKLNHRKDLKGLIGYIHGGQKDKDRERDIADFQADRKRIILANQAAGGIAIDLHDLNGLFPRVSILSPTFSAIQLLQAMGRIHRHGALTKCFQVLAYVAGTIEERACQRVQGKLDNLSLLNDGDLSCGLKLVRVK